MSEPTWVDIASVFVTAFYSLAIGGGLLYIAHRQRKTDELRLSDERFERRFAVFKATDELLYFIREKAAKAPADDHIEAFGDVSKRAYFLFDDNIASFLDDEVLRRARRLALINRNLEQFNLFMDNPALSHERLNLWAWFDEAHRTLPDRFASYLRPDQPMIFPRTRQRIERLWKRTPRKAR